MRRLLTFIGLITCIAGLYYGISYVFNNFDTFLSKFFYGFGILAFIFLIVWIILRLVYGKNWLIGSGKDALVGSDLISAINQTLDELPNPSKPTLSKLGGHLVYRFTRLGIIGLFLASIPIFLLWQQNRKMDIQTQMMDIQNDKMEVQNKKINIQNSLIEAERRSSLVFLMSNVLDKVDDEIKEQQRELKSNDFEVVENIEYSLSKPLVSRIIALSKTFEPYHMLDGDSLSSHLTSPERGQLFNALMGVALDSITQNDIVYKGDFSFADIGNISIEGANLVNANLHKAKFMQANLQNANLSYAFLEEAKLYYSTLTGVDFRNAYVYKANLNDSKLEGANLEGALFAKASFWSSNLEGANLSGVDFSYANFREANLKKTSFNGSVIYSVNFEKAILEEASFEGMHFEELYYPDDYDYQYDYYPVGGYQYSYKKDQKGIINFEKANLKKANLKGVIFDKLNLVGANLSEADLEGAVISKKNILKAHSLYQCKNLDPKIKAELEKEKPCLFTKEGCN